MPENLDVWIEGCDCKGKSSGVKTHRGQYNTKERETVILITRDSGSYSPK